MLQVKNHSVSGRDVLYRDIATGLAKPQKSLPSRWLYDARGSELFETITNVDEYYLTRTETWILKQYGRDIADFIGPDITLLEYGAGAGLKTEILLAAAHNPKLYMPIDIADEMLELAVDRIASRFPALDISRLVADFNDRFDLPVWLEQPRCAFFPGSTIGNLDDEESIAFMVQMHRHVGRRGTAIIGIDLRKDVRMLLAAYDDSEGVTAAFNANVLRRLNREMGANFRLESFRHEARWNEDHSAIEMHLVSAIEQTVSVAGLTIHFEAGESIHTESSRKYDLEVFGETVRRSGWSMSNVWRDPNSLFAVCGMRVI